MSGPQRPEFNSPATKARKRRRWPWIVGSVIAAFIVIAALANSGNQHTSATPTQASVPVAAPGPAAPVVAAPQSTVPPLTPQAPTTIGKTIVYEVISDSPTLNDVTYFDANSAEQQETDVAAPWSKTVVNNSTYVIAGIGAQTNGQSVTCRITVDGKVVDTKTATGQYAVVNCTAPIS
ncbi:MmpS family transport accessory protein [Nocardia terpenica]|uniref:Transport acessory protein MmpS n=1 Tax=Nocardia terpenica TaxID=455432 RepID=A0A6G9Z9Z6_9NOCA|nr:MmpS family transport accessory protein [Nocardia terpenica]QIS22221.1 hypothetical protein F6W96_31645 [Nocardia terpenica]